MRLALLVFAMTVWFVGSLMVSEAIGEALEARYGLDVGQRVSTVLNVVINAIGVLILMAVIT